MHWKVLAVNASVAKKIPRITQLTSIVEIIHIGKVDISATILRTSNFSVILLFLGQIEMSRFELISLLSYLVVCRAFCIINPCFLLIVNRSTASLTTKLIQSFITFSSQSMINFD